MSASKDQNSFAGITLNEKGEKVIAASRRPDGTIRKERRVRDGYIAPEDVQKYTHPKYQEPKNLWAQGVVGAALPQQNSLGDEQSTAKSKAQKKNEKRRLKKLEDRERTESHEGTESPLTEAASEETKDDAKIKKSIEKKLRQIALIREKKASGEPLNEDQLEKLSKEDELLEQLRSLSL